MLQINKLAKLFKDYAGIQDHSIAFSELLDYMLIAFKKYDHEAEQDKALELLSGHKKKDLLVSVITEIGALSEGFGDPLGALYEQCISRGQHGQYFTPPHVSDFMALILLVENGTATETVFDPACGSGRMLLGAAKVNRHLRCYGADIDLICCKIALVNLLLNSLSGEIAHMDSLSNEFYAGYTVATALIDGYHYPYYRNLANREESYIWRQGISKKPHQSAFTTPFNPEKSKHVDGVQGNLFEQ